MSKLPLVLNLIFIGRKGRKIYVTALFLILGDRQKPSLLEQEKQVHAVLIFLFIPTLSYILKRLGIAMPDLYLQIEIDSQRDQLLY